MQRNKVFSIIVIICFCSILLIPIGIALMWFSTNWKKLLKAILTASLSVLYVGLVVILLLSLRPSVNQSGAVLPFNYSKGQTEFNTNVPSKGKEVDEIQEDEFKTESKKKSDKKRESTDADHLPKSIKKNPGKGSGRVIFPLIFFLILMLLIIRQNLKSSKKKTGYENPYVDTNQYKLPLADDAKMPLVHFLKIHLQQDEKIYFATETNQKNNEGNLIVTNKRVIIINLEEGELDFPLELLESVSSVSNSVIMIVSGTRKHYVFLPESQVKYALAVIRWSYKKNNA